MRVRFSSLKPKHWLWASIALGAVIAVDAAHAQQASDFEADIVVTGYRASSRSAVDTKRRSPLILDSVNQDDIAQLPDLNIVEAARRVAGISVNSGADPTKNRDLYQRVTIRGLDPRYNLTTVDGVQIASADQSFRGARLDQLPATLISQVQVIKTLTSAHDPHGLGGQVNLVTKSAFAIGEKRFFAGEAFVGRNSTAGELVSGEKISARANATVSAIFGDTIGVVLSGEYQRLPSSSNAEIYGTDGAAWSYFTAKGARTPFESLSPTGFIVPVSAQGYRFENRRDRTSGNLKVEWRPSERAHLTGFAGYYYLNDVENRYEFLTRPFNSATGGTPDNSGATPPNPVVPTASTGQFALGDIQQGISNQPTRRGTYLLGLQGSVELAPQVTLAAWGSDSQATYREEWNMVKYDTAPRPAVPSSNNYVPQAGYSYVIVDGRPRLTYNNPGIVNDPATYVDMYWRDIDRNLDQRVSFGKLELGYRQDATDMGLNALAAAAITRTKQTWDIIFNERVPASTAAQQAIGSLALVMEPQSFSNLATPGTPYFLVNLDKAEARFRTMTDQFVTTDQTANNYQDDYTDRETTKAAYAQISWRNARFNLLAGLRYDSTDVTVDAFSAPTITGSTAYVPTHRTGHYDFLLPSLIASFEATSAFRLKAAVSKTIGRPDFAQYAARTSYSIGSDGSLSIATGNPDLRPRQAWNFDLSAEWYIGRSSLISVALFDKQLQDEIFTARSEGPPTTFRGTTYTVVRVEAPLNSNKGSVRGVELNIIQDQLPFLHGLGISGNLTLLDGGFDLPATAAAIAAGAAPTRRTSGLIQQPDYIANLTLFFASKRFDAHVSYNRIGKALQSVNQDASWRDLYQQERQQIDLQARYHVRPGVELLFEAQNVTGEPFIVRQGKNGSLLNNYFNVGRVFWLGLSWHPGSRK